MEQPNYDLEDVGRFQHARLIEERDALREECDEMRSLAVKYADEIAALCTELNAALDALKAAPKPPWNFRPTIGWQGDYCDWYEAQVTLWKGLQ